MSAQTLQTFQVHYQRVKFYESLNKIEQASAECQRLLEYTKSAFANQPLQRDWAVLNALLILSDFQRQLANTDKSREFAA